MTSEPTSTPVVAESVSVAVEPQQVAEALSAEVQAPNASGGEAKDSGSSVDDEKITAGVDKPVAQAQDGNEEDDDDVPHFDGDQPRAPIRAPISGAKGSKPSVRR